MAESLNTIFNLLKPGACQYGSLYLRHGESIDLYLDNINEEIVAKYFLFDQPTGDSVVVCSRKDMIDRGYLHHFKNRLLGLIHKGRERFAVRRLVLADIEKPNLSERWQHISTRSAKRGKFKRVNHSHLPSVRIPRLLAVSPLA